MDARPVGAHVGLSMTTKQQDTVVHRLSDLEVLSRLRAIDPHACMIKETEVYNVAHTRH
jgi:hypothetical protein